MSTWNRRANPPATDVKESRNYDGWRVKARWRRVWMSRNRQRQQEKEKQWELEREATAETSKNSSNRKRCTLALIFILCAPLAGTVPFCSPSYTFRCCSMKTAFKARSGIEDSFAVLLRLFCFHWSHHKRLKLLSRSLEIWVQV